MKLEIKQKVSPARKLLSDLLDILYPPRCPFCGKLLADDEKNCCGRCRNGLPLIRDDAQRRDIKSTELCLSMFEYTGKVRDSLHSYKFSGYASYGHDYAALMAEVISRSDISCDVITWVPISRQRMRDRGYDQSELIARELARLFGADCRKLIDKTVNNKAQSSTSSADERRKNTAGVYKIRKTADIKGKSVLIIDDIVTTGSTLGECAAVLMAAGCDRVCAATVAASAKQKN